MVYCSVEKLKKNTKKIHMNGYWDGKSANYEEVFMYYYINKLESIRAKVCKAFNYGGDNIGHFDILLDVGNYTNNYTKVKIVFSPFSTNEVVQAYEFPDSVFRAMGYIDSNKIVNDAVYNSYSLIGYINTVLNNPKVTTHNDLQKLFQQAFIKDADKYYKKIVSVFVNSIMEDFSNELLKKYATKWEKVDYIILTNILKGNYSTKATVSDQRGMLYKLLAED